MANAQIENLQNRNFIRPSDFQALYGVSRSTVFRYVKSGKLPEPNRITARLMGWDRKTLDSIFLK